MDTLTTTSLDSALDSTMSPSNAAFAGGLAGSMLIACLIFFVLIVIAQWKVFEKAGEKGWKSIIPIYGQYILFKIVGAQNWFWGLLCVSIVCSVLVGTNVPAIDWTASQEVINAQIQAIDWSQYPMYITGTIVTGIVSLVVEIVLAIKIAKAFDKGIAYVIGLIFVSPIVLMVLGFGKAKYNKKAVNA